MTEEKKDVEYSPEMQEFLIGRYLHFNKINAKINLVRTYKEHFSLSNISPSDSYKYVAKYYETLSSLMDEITVFVENYLTPEELMSIATVEIFKHCGINEGLFDPVQFGVMRND